MSLESLPPPEDERLIGRNGKIWREYCGGKTQARLAQEYGISQAQVSRIIAQVRNSIPQVDREEELTRSLEMLRELRAGALEIWEMAAAPMVAGKDGAPVYDPETGDLVRDAGGKLRALETALKVDKSLRDLLGLDSPSRLDMSVSTGEQRTAERIAEEAAARLRAEDES